MYYSVFTAYTAEITIKRSRFITNLIPIEDERDLESALGAIKKRYSDATHNCYACIIDQNALKLKFSDDGEPQGTAGQPMLEVLKKRKIYKTLAVVTRYFGGIKLGAGGLVSAYTESVSDALNAADVRKFVYSAIAEIVFNYGDERMIAEVINRSGKIIDKIYTDRVVYKFAVPREVFGAVSKSIEDITRGNARPAAITEGYIDY